MLKQATKPVLASNQSRIDLSRLPQRVFRNPQRSIAQPLVWSELVMIAGVRLHYVVQLSEAETEKMIQALAL